MIQISLQLEEKCGSLLLHCTGWTQDEATPREIVCAGSAAETLGAVLAFHNSRVDCICSKNGLQLPESEVVRIKGRIPGKVAQVFSACQVDIPTE